MHPNVAPVSRALFSELCGIRRRERFPLRAIIQRLCDEYAIAQRIGFERLLLFGNHRDNEANETLVGTLIALTPGIVLFDGGEGKDALTGGLFERTTRDAQTPFDTRVPVPFYAHLCIHLSTFPNARKPRYKTYPAWIDFQIGNGQGEDYGAFGIDPGRWDYLQTWLNTWLPREPNTQPLTR
ncbi:MAG: hypothetical protein WCV84_01225 [Patescibacteria group bacterium]